MDIKESKLKGVCNILPYQYIRLWTTASKTMPFEDFNKNAMNSTVQVLHNAIDGKVITICDELIPMLQDSDVKESNTNFPYDSFFINNDIEFNDFLFKGVGIFKAEDGDFRMAYVCVNKSEDFEFYGYHVIEEGIVEKMHNYKIPNGKRASKHIINFLFNFANLINSEREIEYIVRKADYNSNTKRKKRGKFPKLTDTYLRVTGNLKRYATKYCENRNSYHIRYLVRGHWRKFNSQRYTNSKGKKVWIKPYWKGEGVDVSRKFVKVK